MGYRLNNLASIWVAFFALPFLSAPVVAQPQNVAAPSETEAPIALLVDVTSGQVLHARNENRRFVPASITKAMTLLLAFELMEEGNLRAEQIISLRQETWEEWSGKGSTMFLPANARVSVAELLTAIANVSANDGSVMLAEGYAGSVAKWTSLMNAKAREVGMVNSHFGTPNGWPDEGRTFTTASDLVTMAEALVTEHYALFSRFIGRPQFTYNGITQPNRDPLLGRVEGADGIKTGFTNEAGFGFLGTAERDGRRLVMVIAGVSRNSERARLSRRYIEWGFQAFDQKAIFSTGEIAGRARVQGGSTRSVELVTERDVFVNIPKDTQEAPSARIVYDGPVRAPFAAGDEIAMLEVIVPGMEPARVPLVAAESVAEAGVISRIINGFMGWVD